MTNHPKIGIRPIIDGRRRGVRESLEDQTMNMARRVAALYEAAGMPEGLLARLRDQEVGAFLERARAELNL